MRIQFTNFVSSSVFPCFFIYWVSLFTGYIKTDNHFLIAPLFFLPYRYILSRNCLYFPLLRIRICSLIPFWLNFRISWIPDLILKTIDCYPSASFCFSLLSWSPAVFLFTLSASKAICPRCIINKHICGKIGHGKTSLWFYFCCKFILIFSRRFFL